MFESSRTYGLFTAYFDEELLYHYFGSINSIIGVIGVTRVLEDVEISQRNYSQYQYLKRFLKQDFTTIHKVSQIPDKFKPYITTRIDVKLMSAEGDFEIVSVSDDKANVSKPSWFQKDGIGYVVQSYAGQLDFTAKATVDGKVQLGLKGMDIRLPEDKSKSIPYWIDYTNLTINDEPILGTLTPAWYGDSYTCTIDAKADEEIKIHVEWLPHRSDA